MTADDWMLPAAILGLFVIAFLFGGVLM